MLIDISKNLFRRDLDRSRRQFLNQLGTLTLGTGLLTFVPSELLAAKKKFTFEISLAEFSFASELFSGKMKNMDFPERAKKEFGISTVEYVSGFFNGKHTDSKYLKELKQRCDDLEVNNHLIMVDGENLAALDKTQRDKAVQSHVPWLEAAKFLGCSKIRVNLGDAMAVLSGKDEEGTPEDVAQAAIEGYSKLCEHADKMGLEVIVENHFGYSTDPDWLLKVINNVPSSRKGFLPDFGNFCAKRSKPESFDLKGIMATKCVKEYDKYEGVRKMMPFAKGISAKTHKFDAQGNDVDTDFMKIFKIIKKSGWTGGYVGIEYEGGLMRDMGGDTTYLPNAEGIRATKALLERVREKLHK